MCCIGMKFQYFTLDSAYIHLYNYFISQLISEHANFGRGITGIGENFICIGEDKIKSTSHKFLKLSFLKGSLAFKLNHFNVYLVKSS